ncbi:ABC transporter permease DevC [Singulisphaera sp. PoT]|uniref:ABC transporter permease DevC n=1 Tax=Singulisphaera sp. PoT TaxID=3411797 RepID=UPI003BF4B0B5
MSRMRRVPLAWRNLTENRRRLAASVAGAAFAVVLMLLQNGFRDALLDNMSSLIARMDGDLFLTNRARYMISHPAPFPRRRLAQALDVEGIAGASPIYIDAERTRWRNPLTGLSRRIRVVAFPPREDVLDIEAVKARRNLWDRPESALADDRSKQDLYGKLAAGTVSELNGRTVKLVGTFSLGTDFRSNGTILMSEQNMLAYYPDRRGTSWGETKIDVGVLRLRPGSSPMQVKRDLEARLPRDVIVLTKARFLAKEQDFWENAAPLGVVFDIGVAMGFVVGLAICYQVLFSEISDRLPEFATLKAIGYSNFELLLVVVEEAVYLALFGFASGLVVSLGLFLWLESSTGLEMSLKPPGAAMILALTIVMCVLAGSLAARRLLSLDPAELYE